VNYLDTMTEKVSIPLSKNQLQQRERNARKARSRTLTKDQLKQKESNAREAREARTGSCPFSEIQYKKEQRTALKELSLQHGSKHEREAAPRLRQLITHHVVPPRPGGERLGQDLVFEMSECARQPISPCGCSRLSRTIFRNCLSGGDEPAYLRFHQFKAIMLFIVLLYHPLAVILVTILRDITQSPPISSSFLKKLQPMLVA
jgi:hypothetical protein